MWTTEAVDNGVKLSHFSPDGDEGYPGNLSASVTYRLEKNTLSVLYHAQTDRTTPINLTNHSYFNLAGQVQQFINLVLHCVAVFLLLMNAFSHLQGTPDIYDHEVTISAESYLPVDDTMIPTGIVSHYFRELDLLNVCNQKLSSMVLCGFFTMYRGSETCGEDSV